MNIDWFKNLLCPSIRLSRLRAPGSDSNPGPYTVKKFIDFPVPRRDVTDQTLPGREYFNYSRPGRVWSVTSRLGTGKSVTFFYSVPSGRQPCDLALNCRSIHNSIRRKCLTVLNLSTESLQLGLWKVGIV
jgi:hypothetical protein